MDFIHTYESQISDSKPVLAFTTSELVPKLSDSNIPIVLIGSNTGTGQISKIDKIVNTLDEMMKTEPNRKRIKERVTQDDTAKLLYSSGTTGASKGVISYHRNLIARVQMVIGRFQLDDNQQTFLYTYLDVTIMQGYGLTESIGIGASTDTVEESRRYGTAGKLSANMMGKIVDPERCCR
ncbi:putative AMP-dependent synthetase/ligase, AMP-binding, AMP-dependent synthetase-like superfamily [Helianthus annuus]|uniref:AMP-dependent synthetase/ligase n=1 Tax=Helianthus annuus TaxID=4232 RepID=A0A251SYL0_HELAN|nr:putative AMP-dependent synthetase/ligase [Helianthus annuus]KAJ0475509.1 putative AMP-dependent synthetase/ligase, AMP-binding protein [Helianthus annuus]KAJ0482562.1 putative AMP-dependent synthetase/ligase, AMP-binding, AMP-dependent synthetase-like superfamily [Helianthus annuus]KAJ0498809.1 putative AMP-dependent synthetase/ligase, AMP-binding protein [Helianthus annuus]KAJ0664829.1 putative AMP-dependent synthetase/ligase, AMP-binding, ANL domain-containing protein [Helianthus annuus]